MSDKQLVEILVIPVRCCEIFLLAAFLVLALVAQCHSWANRYDHILYFVCPRGQHLSRIKSEHNNHYED